MTQDNTTPSSFGEIKTNSDGTVQAGNQTFASMEDFVDSIRSREDDIKGKEKKQKK